MRLRSSKHSSDKSKDTNLLLSIIFGPPRLCCPWNLVYTSARAHLDGASCLWFRVFQYSKWPVLSGWLFVYPISCIRHNAVNVAKDLLSVKPRTLQLLGKAALRRGVVVVLCCLHICFSYEQQKGLLWRFSLSFLSFFLCLFFPFFFLPLFHFFFLSVFSLWGSFCITDFCRAGWFGK